MGAARLHDWETLCPLLYPNCDGCDCYELYDAPSHGYVACRTLTVATWPSPEKKHICGVVVPFSILCLNSFVLLLILLLVLLLLLLLVFLMCCSSPLPECCVYSTHSHHSCIASSTSRPPWPTTFHIDHVHVGHIEISLQYNMQAYPCHTPKWGPGKEQQRTSTLDHMSKQDVTVYVGVFCRGTHEEHYMCQGREGVSVKRGIWP